MTPLGLGLLVAFLTSIVLAAAAGVIAVVDSVQVGRVGKRTSIWRRRNALLAQGFGTAALLGLIGAAILPPTLRDLQTAIAWGNTLPLGLRMLFLAAVSYLLLPTVERVTEFITDQMVVPVRKLEARLKDQSLDAEIEAQISFRWAASPIRRPNTQLALTLRGRG